MSGSVTGHPPPRSTPAARAASAPGSDAAGRSPERERRAAPAREGAAPPGTHRQLGRRGVEACGGGAARSLSGRDGAGRGEEGCQAGRPAVPLPGLLATVVPQPKRLWHASEPSALAGLGRRFKNDERRGVARGVLTQRLEPLCQPVAYLSKRLDPVASGWSTCVRQIAATALLVKDADKLTLRQALAITSSMRWKPYCRLRWKDGYQMPGSPSTRRCCLTSLRYAFVPPAVLNPATLLPEGPGTPLRSCPEVLATILFLCSDLMDLPLWDPDGQMEAVLWSRGKDKLEPQSQLHQSPVAGDSSTRDLDPACRTYCSIKGPEARKRQVG
ncbi:uncharacterized protein [Oryctolagus cuniculus]|uniref:uncharacterized protein n=1 Tax=Oryctolagus cuniculus TaxID=9986 RepID=UPI003879F8E8